MKPTALCGHEVEEYNEPYIEKYCNNCLNSLDKYNNNPKFHRLVSIFTRAINSKDFTLEEINEAVAFINGHKQFINKKNVSKICVLRKIFMITRQYNNLKILTVNNQKEKVYLAKKARENYLFISKFGYWSDGLLNIYRRIIRDNNSEYVIKLGLIDEIYVAVSTLYKYDNRVEVFVKPKYRRMGIGSLMIDTFHNYGTIYGYDDATRNSNKFFENVKVEISD